MQLCYHCCHEISGEKLGMPSHKSKSGTYVCQGQFCSFPCMKTYALELNDSYKNTKISLISQMFYETTGETRCKFAPRKEQLKIFGGDLDISQFRAESLNSAVIKYIPPMEHVTFIFDKHENFVLKKENDHLNSTNIQNEPIKLQRPSSKPIKNSQNTLEQTMGLSSILNKST